MSQAIQIVEREEKKSEILILVNYINPQNNILLK